MDRRTATQASMTYKPQDRWREALGGWEQACALGAIGDSGDLAKWGVMLMELCGVRWYASLGGVCVCAQVVLLHMCVCSLGNKSPSLWSEGQRCGHISRFFLMSGWLMLEFWMGFGSFPFKNSNTSSDTGHFSFATWEVIEKCNWINCYSQHGVDRSLMLLAALKVGAGVWLIRVESISEGSKSAGAEAGTHGVEKGGTGTPFLHKLRCFGDWSWELSPLLIARWCLSWIFILACSDPA